MRRFHPAGHFFAERREKLRDHAIPGESFPVFRVEKRLSNDPTCVDNEIPRPCHAFELPRCFGVQYFVGLDRLGIGISQQGKFNLAMVREILEYFYAVVADRRELEPLALESRSCTLQL